MLASVIVETSNVWFDIGMIVVGAGTLSAIAAGVYVAQNQLGLAAVAQKRQAKIAEAEHLMGMLRRWSELLLQEARHLADDYKDGKSLRNAMEKFEKKHDEREFVLLRIPAFFEDLGILVGDMEVIEVESVRNSMASSIDYYWTKFEPYILDLRTERRKIKATDKVPIAYAWFEDLWNEVS